MPALAKKSKKIRDCPKGKSRSKRDSKHRCIQHNTRHSCHANGGRIFNESSGRCVKNCRRNTEALGRRRGGASTLCVKKCAKGEVRGKGGNMSRRCAKKCPAGTARVNRRPRNGKKSGSTCKKVRQT